MAAPRSLSGGYLCGNIRFVAWRSPLKPHSCSCSMCQKHSGAPTVAWVEYVRDAVEWTGPGGSAATYRSSEISSRAFCPLCGSTIGAIDDDPVVALVTGAFDKPDAAALRPVKHSFRSGKPRWLEFNTK